MGQVRVNESYELYQIITDFGGSARNISGGNLEFF